MNNYWKSVIVFGRLCVVFIIFWRICWGFWVGDAMLLHCLISYFCVHISVYLSIVVYIFFKNAPYSHNSFDIFNLFIFFIRMSCVQFMQSEWMYSYFFNYAIALNTHLFNVLNCMACPLLKIHVNNISMYDNHLAMVNLWQILPHRHTYQ